MTRDKEYGKVIIVMSKYFLNNLQDTRFPKGINSFQGFTHDNFGKAQPMVKNRVTSILMTRLRVRVPSVRKLTVAQMVERENFLIRLFLG